MHLYPVNGAAGRVGQDETAWSYRDATWAEVIVGVDPDPANKERIVEWARQYWDAVHPYSAGGAYVNFMMDEGEERVKASYRENYERLAAIKATYDPDQLLPREPEHQARPVSEKGGAQCGTTSSSSARGLRDVCWPRV